MYSWILQAFSKTAWKNIRFCAWFNPNIVINQIIINYNFVHIVSEDHQLSTDIKYENNIGTYGGQLFTMVYDSYCQSMLYYASAVYSRIRLPILFACSFMENRTRTILRSITAIRPTILARRAFQVKKKTARTAAAPLQGSTITPFLVLSRFRLHSSSISFSPQLFFSRIIARSSMTRGPFPSTVDATALISVKNPSWTWRVAFFILKYNRIWSFIFRCL